MKPNIILEVTSFLETEGMSAYRLCCAAGVHPTILSRVLRGDRNDMWSVNADKLRKAMRELATPNPITPLEDIEESHE